MRARRLAQLALCSLQTPFPSHETEFHGTENKLQPQVCQGREILFRVLDKRLLGNAFLFNEL